MKRRNFFITFTIFLLHSSFSYAKDELIDLVSDKDLELIFNTNEIEEVSNSNDINLSDLENNDDLSELEEIDNLQELKKDIEKELQTSPINKKTNLKIKRKKEKIKIFNIGKHEKKLLQLSKFIERKIPKDEWNEISTASKLQKYIVQKGEYLWKISQNLFGTGFYYSKIWAMNPQITNPNEIEPGQVLVFDTGDSVNMPKFSFGSFDENKKKRNTLSNASFERYGEDISLTWLKERRDLIKKGAFFQSLNEFTYNDILDMPEYDLNEEYKRYEAPIHTALADKTSHEDFSLPSSSNISKGFVNFKKGFYLNTFLTTNLVQDLGKIVAKKNESIYIQNFESIYVRFNENLKIRPGDLFSIYNSPGSISHKISDRRGHEYTILAQIKAIKKIDKVWECKVIDLTDVVMRGARVTIYTPKIDKILQTYNKRNIEAAIIGSFRQEKDHLSYGDIAYLDRGRMDGITLGNIFEVFSFKDRGTGEKISSVPSYKMGELVVVTLSDNFATALVSQSSTTMSIGSLSLSKLHKKSLQNNLLERSKLENSSKQKIDLENLDVELNLDDLSANLLDQIDNIEIEEDELEELDRQERENSIIDDHKRDLNHLERIEKELIDAEDGLNEKMLDEDTYLEKIDLNSIEKGSRKKNNPNAFESLDEIENETGKQYMDEEINEKENPYGLTEYDIEEIDELLNNEN